MHLRSASGLTIGVAPGFSPALRAPTRLAKSVACLALIAALGCCASAAVAQPAPAPAASGGGATTILRSEPSTHPETLVFFNRPIMTLRARITGREPADRVAGSLRVLEELAARRIAGPVETRSFDGGVLVTIAGHGVLVVTTADVDELSGENVAESAAGAAERLRSALEADVASRSLDVILRAIALALLAGAAAALILWGLVRAHRFLAGKLTIVAERTVAGTGFADLDSLRASRLLDVQRGFIKSIAAAAGLVIVYATAGFVLRQFPYTRPWGESMRGFLISTAQHLALGVMTAVPGLFTAAVILLIARFLVRVVGLWFTAVEDGRVKARYIFPDTAQPTRRLLTTLLWLFAIVVAYPYLPGSQTDAFKGVSVFLGLMVTFGSSGLVNQIMSGFMLTYSRAVRLGDFVKIGDVEGTVIHLGVLSTKLRTLWNEEVTIPNAVVVSQTTIDYSRSGDTAGVFTPTSVTIGYDAPWRQVRALLLQAADRTPGLRTEPKPFVIQAALMDFYVQYTLLVSLEHQQSRPLTLNALHGHIQDLFNEHGVQIMSPNYMYDPAAPKIVPRARWFEAPAEGDGTPPGPSVPVRLPQDSSGQVERSG
jgi:small-conductance mechanosensitive channel